MCRDTLCESLPLQILQTIPIIVCPVAGNELQPMDATLLHLLPADRGLLRAQHVCGSRGGELPQVPASPGG